MASAEASDPGDGNLGDGSLGGAEAQAEEAAAQADAAPVWMLALRDLAIVLAAFSLFAAADAWYAATDVGFAAVLSVLDGILVGGLVTFLIHEWGHFAGARLAGGIAPTGPLSRFFPLFVYDMNQQDDRSFRWMGIAGNAAHWAAVLFFVLVLPLDTPGRIALVSGAFGQAVFASTTEFPVIQLSYGGASAAESFAGLTGPTLKRNGLIGAAAGLVLFALLS